MFLGNNNVKGDEHMIKNNVMQKVCMYEFGTSKVMKLEEQAIPIPGSGEVIVRIAFASVNFLDIQHRRGDLVTQNFYQKKGGISHTFPVTLGSQGVGTVEAIGPNVETIQVGDRVVCAGGSGTYASHVLISSQRVIPIPDEISFEHAAAGLIQGFLAWAFTNYAYPIKKEDWCLIHAAAGGIGLFLCQMAKIRGGHVIGVTSKKEKARYVLEAGADEVIISTQSDIVKEVKRITNGQGVNVVYDGVGKDTFDASLNSLALGGYMINYGQSSGYVPPIDLMTLQEKGSLFITRTNGLPYMKYWSQYIRDFVTWVQSGKLSIKIDRTYSLADADLAHEAVERRETSGRILLTP